MKSVAALIRAGVDPDLIQQVVEDMVSAATVTVSAPRSAGASRQARYREKKERNESVSNHNESVTKRHSDVTSDASQERPHTPKENPPPPSDPLRGSSVGTPRGGQPQGRATRLPPNWRPSEAGRDFARQRGFDEAAINLETEKIINWSASSPKGACRDWEARWRNWILQAGPPPARAGPAPQRRTNNALDFFSRPDHDHASRDFTQDDSAPFAGVTIDG